MKAAALIISVFALLALAPVRAVEAPDWMQHQVATLQVGAVLDVSSLNPVQSLPRHQVSRAWTGGTLVFSDAPEYVKGPGILYADTLEPGPARIFLYHVNATASTGSPRLLKFSVVVEPADPARPVGLTILRRSVQGPSTSYYGVGVGSALDLLGLPESPAIRTVSNRQVLDPELERRVPSSSYPLLVCGQYDLEVTGAALKFAIVAVDDSTDTVSALDALAPLARDGGDRGTFPGQAKKLVMSAGIYGTSSGLAQFRMASGVSYTLDPDLFAGEGGYPGRDALLDTPSRVLGNYGVVYTVKLRLRSSDGRRVAVLLNPRGGDYAGAVGTPDAMTGGGTFPAPATGVLPHTVRATLLGRWDPAVTPEPVILWTPPGASSLPVDWILVPYPEPGDVDGGGAVDLRDALLAARLASGTVSPTSRQRIAADLAPAASPDGAVTPADVTAILRLTAGL